MSNQILNTETSRKLLEMSRSAFWRARKQGKIEPSMEINGRAYYTLETLAKMIEKPKAKK